MNKIIKFIRRLAGKRTRTSCVSKHEHLKTTQNKIKIMKEFEKKNTLKNKDVRKLLGLTTESSRRYLNELTTEGLLIKKGNAGCSVHYVKS